MNDADLDGALVIAAITLRGTAVALHAGMLSRDPQRRLKVSLLVFGGFVLIAGFLLFEEHRAHVLGALPYILGLAGLLFCIFGHRHAGTWRPHDDTHGGAR